jgi:hypothetical protein
MNGIIPENCSKGTYVDRDGVSYEGDMPMVYFRVKNERT